MIDSVFEVPTYEFAACAFTALGAIVAFGKLSHARVKTWALSYLFDIAFPGKDSNKVLRIFMECLVFVALGIIVAIAVTKPANPMQAIAAGMSWAALLGKFK
ncbi:hypothetical protein [Variovorax sp. YR566]|uniref:hypothetical protein n=1 Tax=Variovorax sp. YR566 TaxID=3450237 RepID=UPI003F80DEF0